MRRISLHLLICAALFLSACGGSKVLVTRGTTVPLELQTMSGDQLMDYFKATSLTAYKDGSRIEASVVMVDLAYLKATGQLMEAPQEEIEALASRRRFETHIDYVTPTIFPGETEGEGIVFEKWTVTLRDSRGTEITPATSTFDPPLIEKEAVVVEQMLAEEETSKLIMTYTLKGNMIFDYVVPEGCKWVEIELEPPLTGHRTSVRWNIKN
jgi:hypothetical protein